MMTNDITKYAFAGLAFSLGDKLSSMKLKDEFNKANQSKETYKALDFVIETYEKAEFDNLKKDTQFADAFVQTREYFSQRIQNQSIDSNVSQPQSASTKYSSKTKNIGKYFTKDFWANEQLNNMSAWHKLWFAVAVPLAFDLEYIIYGGLTATISFSDGLKEVGETPFEAAGLMAGLYVGKGVSWSINKYTHRYDKKIERLANKIGLNEDLKSELAKEISVNIPKPIVVESPKNIPVDKPVANESTALVTEKTEPVDPIEGITAAHKETMNKMDALFGKRN